MRTMIGLLMASLLLCAGSLALAGSTVDPAHPYAYAANAGWIDARADGTNGAVIGQSYCTGSLWSANIGWIGLGNGPSNGWHYANLSGADWGVNHDGQGRLTGYAWAANVGWITFEQAQGQPRLDLRTGSLSGYVWGANVGWISLAGVRTLRLDAGPDADHDGLPDAWELAHATSLTVLSGGSHDADGDGVSDADEYLADTDPLNPADSFRIVSLAVGQGTNTLAWNSRPTRLYQVEAAESLKNGTWSDASGGLLGPQEVSPMRGILSEEGTVTSRFYRVRSVIPLSQ